MSAASASRDDVDEWASSVSKTSKVVDDRSFEGKRRGGVVAPARVLVVVIVVFVVGDVVVVVVVVVAVDSRDVFDDDVDAIVVIPIFRLVLFFENNDDLFVPKWFGSL